MVAVGRPTYRAHSSPETCQSDFAHDPLTDTHTFPKGVEIITWLDDCARYALHTSAQVGPRRPG